jgi:hypothetical protein
MKLAAASRLRSLASSVLESIMAASGRENGPSSFVNGSGLPDLAPRYVQSAGWLAAASAHLAGFIDPALASSADVTYFA